MSDLEEVRRKKMEELKQQQESAEKQAQVEMQLGAAVKQMLTEEANQRLNNVKLVNRELYLRVTQTILYLQRQGQLDQKLEDAELKLLLEKLAGTKREISIKRK